MFSNAKVGQRVWSYTYGWGEVSKQSEHNELEVHFKELTKKVWFTHDGRQDISAINQDLFYDEIKVEIPESAKKPKVEWKFPCYGKTEGGLIVWFWSESRGTVAKHSKHSMRVGDNSNEWNMDIFTPCTLEAKDL